MKIIRKLVFLSLACGLLSGCLSLGSTGQKATGGKREQAVELARRHLGTPYRYGGTDPRGFDCSGLVVYVFRQLGVELPHDAARQYASLSSVSRPQPGDLVFYHTYGSGISHVGIYAGDNRFIHSPTTGKTVEYADMGIDYWKTRYRGARRVF